MNANNVAEVEVFVASALDFRSQVFNDKKSLSRDKPTEKSFLKLGSNHQGILTSTFNSAKSRSPFFAAVGVALDKCENDSPPFL